KRVNGQLVRVEEDGWKEALELYKDQADDLHAGRTPRVKSDQLTLAQICNQFLTAKLRKLETGEISRRMFQEYKDTTDMYRSLTMRTTVFNFQCAAKSKRSGARCRNYACRDRATCRMHGGRSRRGADHPNFRDGRHSKVLHEALD